jgi:DDE domain
VVEQDHRTVKKRVWLAKGYGSFATAWRTLQGIEAVNMIRKGRARWVAKGDAITQAAFIAALFWHRRLTPNPCRHRILPLRRPDPIFAMKPTFVFVESGKNLWSRWLNIS